MKFPMVIGIVTGHEFDRTLETLGGGKDSSKKHTDGMIQPRLSRWWGGSGENGSNSCHLSVDEIDTVDRIVDGTTV
jgi:hypothetical protein